MAAPADSEDTDTLLALVSSLVEGDFDQAAILDALVQSGGDVERAAQLLNSGKLTQRPASAAHVKQKRTKGGLDQWLQRAESSSSTILSTSNLKRRRSLSPPVPILPPSSDTLRQLSPKKPRSTAESTSAKAKTVTNEQFMAILRPPNSADAKKVGPPKFAPLQLTTPEQVAKHTPCTLHTSVLPPELACRLFYTMLDESESWQRNKWWLFDRIVESPHRTSFFVRRSLPEANGYTSEDMHEAAQFWYNGRQVAPPDSFPSAMEEACDYIEKIVNAEMHKRDRFALEWGGEPPPGKVQGAIGTEERDQVIWRANVAASNRYEGSQESVGLHSDQLTNLGPYATIASLSLGTTRIFRLREVISTDEKDKRSARTYNIPLAHNTLAIMHASCQETFKHSIPPQRVIDPFHPSFPRPRRGDAESHPGAVDAASDDGNIPPSNARINITFRFFRPDYRPSTTPRCKCGVPCILRPDMKNRYSVSKDTTTARSKDGGGDSRKSEDAKKDAVAKYWWTCYAGASNDGKGCDYWKVMDVKAEGRGPFAGEIA